MLNTLQVHWKSSFAIFVYPPTPRFHDEAPVFSRVSAICEYGVFHTKYLASLTNQNARFYLIMRF